MNPQLLKFHHFGLAVRRPDEARKLADILGYQTGDPVFDPSQNVNLQMCDHPVQPAIEIIWPGNGAGPVDKLVERHPGGLVYHLCYETENLPAALEALAQQGLRPICISPATPAPLFGGRKVSFYNVVGIGLIEILE